MSLPDLELYDPDITDELFAKKFDDGTLTPEDVRRFFLDRHTDPERCVSRVCQEPDISWYNEYADRMFWAVFKCGNRYFQIEGCEDLLDSTYSTGEVTEVYPHKKMITVYTHSKEKEKRSRRPRDPKQIETRYVPWDDPDLEWKNWERA